jgi:signal transduction histidine kinase
MPHNKPGGEEEIHTLQLVLSRLEHELRSPLQAVSGFARLLRDRVSPDARDLADLLCAAIDQLTGFAEELRTVAALGGEATDIDDVSVGLDEIVARAVAVVQWQARRDEVSIVVDVDPHDAPVPEALGAVRCAQLFTNVLTNATTFAPPGTTVHLTGRRSPTEWTFLVIDEGPGVAPGDEERIFLPFVRGGTRPGTGLGLYIVRSVLEAVGGSIRVERTPGATGATFRVVIPHLDKAT